MVEAAPGGAEGKGREFWFRSRDGRRVKREVRPSDRIHLLLGVVAMGLSHAVFPVQTLHEWIIRNVPEIIGAARPREWGLRRAHRRAE